MGEGSRAGGPHLQPRPVPVATEARSGLPGSGLGDESREAHSRSMAPDPVTGLLGTYFKEITQRAEDDSCKYLGWVIYNSKRLKITSGQWSQKPGGDGWG